MPRMVTCDAFDSTKKESTTPKGVAFHTPRSPGQPPIVGNPGLSKVQPRRDWSCHHPPLLHHHTEKDEEDTAHYANQWTGMSITALPIQTQQHGGWSCHHPPPPPHHTEKDDEGMAHGTNKGRTLPFDEKRMRGWTRANSR